MEITEKLLKPVIETKYLSVENADRYRCILRFFYLNYEKLKYWMYQEDVFEELHQQDYFKDYTLEQCQQDLGSLVEWKNLVTIQDTRNVSSIQEFKNKKFRYQMSEYGVEIERLVLRLENLFIEGGSLEPTLLERMKQELLKVDEVLNYDVTHTYTWWNDLNNNFIRLNQNYQDYIRDLNSVKAEEMMKSRTFLVFKDHLVEYLRDFVKSLQINSGVITEVLKGISQNSIRIIVDRVVEYEMSIPRMDVEVKEKDFYDKNYGRYESLTDWFVGTAVQTPESEKLFDATNKIIQRMTRYANQISEQTGSSANRKEEYAYIAQMFLNMSSVEDAHCLSASIFGVERLVHLQGDFTRSTDSMNSRVYEEKAEERTVTPRIRTYREKTARSPIVDRTLEKQKMLEKIQREEEKRVRVMQSLAVNDEIDFAKLPKISSEVRDSLLQWISRALEDSEQMARTEEGRQFRVAVGHDRCKVNCTDGIMDMPHFRIVFTGDGQ